MIKERMMIAIISAICGAGLMLLAIGGKPASGIEGWTPANSALASTLKLEQAAEDSQKEPKATSSDAGGPKQPAVPAQPSSLSPQASGAGGKSAVENGGIPAADSGSTGEAQGSPVPASSPSGAAANSVQVQTADDGKIHINAAGLSELQEIPGIGEKKAQAILDYRTQQGAFSSLSELSKVKGIGDKILKKMLPYISL